MQERARRDVDRVDRAAREEAGRFGNAAQGFANAGAAKTAAFGAGLAAGLGSVGSMLRSASPGGGGGRGGERP